MSENFIKHYKNQHNGFFFFFLTYMDSSNYSIQDDTIDSNYGENENKNKNKNDNYINYILTSATKKLVEGCYMSYIAKEANKISRRKYTYSIYL